MNRTFLIAAVLVTMARAAYAQPAKIEAARETLRQADIALTEAAAAKNVERVVSMFAEDAVMLPPDGSTVTGLAGIRNVISEITTLPGLAIRSSPARVEVSENGDMGFTLKTIELSSTGPDGRPSTDRLKDFHLWRRQPDATWKLIVDVWNSEPSPVAPTR